MSWHPEDLVTDGDLKAYESTILTGFGQGSWLDKRTKALEDWLFPILDSEGYDPERLRTRYDPAVVWQLTGAVYTDVTSAARSVAVDDLDLAAIFATPGTDALLVGSASRFRGVYLRLDDAPSAVASTMTVAYWNGLWSDLVIDDGTLGATGVTLSKGGAVTWTLPPDWTPRVVNASSRYYWARVTVSATPTSATAAQVATIRASRLRAAATFRTLHLIMAEAPTSQDGPWAEKADFYAREADRALRRALPLIGGEFDTSDTEQITAADADQTAEEAGGGAFALERG